MTTVELLRYGRQVLAASATLSLGLAGTTLSADLSPWPLGSWEKADHSLGRLDNSMSRNLSGSHWDPASGQLLLVVNKPGTILVLEHSKQGFKVKHKFSFDGDLEGVTRVPQFPNDIFVLEEKKSEILRFRVKRNSLHLIQSWKLSKKLPNSGRSGPEGITFIPNSDIKDLAVGGKKNNKGGFLGGIFCIAHQNGGNLYFFDLMEKDFRYLGDISTREKESSGLEYDTRKKQLYIWHNIHKNSLEVVYLHPAAKKHKLRLAAHFQGPKKGNLESVAVGPLAGSISLFLTDDDNQDNVPVLWYKRWPEINNIPLNK